MKKIILLASLLFAFGMPSLMAKDKVFTSFLGGAIRGYDPVAYFMQSKPVKGSSKYQHQWNGATWRFSSKKNLNLFKSNPEKYSPQYGGFCAYAMAVAGQFASTIPEAWTIKNGKLYLNFSLDVRENWESNIAQYIEVGDNNWNKIWN